MMSKRERANLAAGVCRICAGPRSATHNQYCEYHRLKDLESVRRRALCRAEEGRCRTCGKPADGHRLCSKHNLMQNLTVLIHEKKRKKKGICLCCAKPRSQKSALYCEFHRLREKKRHHINYLRRRQKNILANAAAK